DYLEANAEEYWHVPTLEVLGRPQENGNGGDEEDIYSAAYDDVTYRDSTDDANESDVVGDGGPREEFDLEAEGGRLEKRLRFLSALARLWQIAARFVASVRGREREGAAESDAALAGWLNEARAKQQRLLTLLDAIHGHAIPEPTGDYDSLVEYD